MTPEEGVAAVLSTFGAVTALVSTRIYVEKLPQQAIYPAVLVQLVDEVTDYHLRGGSRRMARVQVDAYAKDEGDGYATVMALADAIHGDDAASGLSGWRGSVGSPPFDITGILRIDRTRGYEPEEFRLLRQRQDYEVHFETF